MFIGAKKLALLLPFMFVSATALELQDFGSPVVDEFIRKFDTSHSIPLMPLRGGMSSSQVYKFELGRKAFVLRTLAPDINIENRISEIKMHEFMAAHNLAPKILLIDNETDPKLIIMEYIDGRNFNQKTDFNNKAIVSQIIKGMKIIHTSTDIQFSGPSMLDSIELQIKGTQNKLPQAILKCYEELKKSNTDYGAFLINIHGDLAPGNILISKDGSVYFMDFQEARKDSLFAEFGYFFYESGMTDLRIIQSILAEYLGRNAGESELKATLFYMRASALLCGLYRLDWIDASYTTADLDMILAKLTERGTSYFKDGDYDKRDLEGMDSEKRMKYVLSFFNDFINM